MFCISRPVVEMDRANERIYEGGNGVALSGIVRSAQGLDVLS